MQATVASGMRHTCQVAWATGHSARLRSLTHDMLCHGDVSAVRLIVTAAVQPGCWQVAGHDRVNLTTCSALNGSLP